MAGPFDTYDIKFSEYTPQIDASLYTNALMHKRDQFDKGFERIQQSVDRLGTLPVIGEENKKAFQGKLDEHSQHAGAGATLLHWSQGSRGSAREGASRGVV